MKIMNQRLRFRNFVICPLCEHEHIYLSDFLSISFRRERLFAHCGGCGFNNFNELTERDIIIETEET